MGSNDRLRPAFGKDHMKVLDVIWFTEMGNIKPIGIVLVKKDDDTIAAYVGTGDGISENSDMQKIAEQGARFSLVAAQALGLRIKNAELMRCDSFEGKK